MKFKFLIFALIFMFIPSITFSAQNLPAKKIKIAVTTSNLYCLVNEICKDKVEIKTIIPSTVCPSTYDIDAQTIKDISKSNIILYHYWQPWVKSLKLKIANFGIVYREIKTEGNFMIPYINLRAAKEITDLFCIWDQDNKEFYEKNFLDYSFRINFLTEEIIKNGYNKYNKKIVCNSQISTFMEWLGFDVAVKYSTASNLSANDMAFLIKKIKKEKIKYVVDNLQAGTDIGRRLAEDLKLTHTVISNFPLANSYINTLKNNIEKINKAIN